MTGEAVNRSIKATRPLLWPTLGFAEQFKAETVWLLAKLRFHRVG